MLRCLLGNHDFSEEFAGLTYRICKDCGSLVKVCDEKDYEPSLGRKDESSFRELILALTFALILTAFLVVTFLCLPIHQERKKEADRLGASFQGCYEGECAWYDGNMKACAVLDLAASVRWLADEFVTVSKNLPRR